MVHNYNRVLDENQIKYVQEVYMPKYNRHYTSLIDMKVNKERMDYTDRFNPLSVPNENYKPMRPNTNLYKYYNDICMDNETYRNCAPFRDEDSMLFEYVQLQEVCDYLEIVPFIPCYNLHLSPGWKGKDKMKHKSAVLKGFIDYITKLNGRFTTCSYVIECGSEGDFVHAHIVLDINPKMLKTVRSQHKKGNLINSIKKVWKTYNKDTIFPDIPINCIGSIINKEELLMDKLNYLHEDLKPDDHKNMALEGFPILHYTHLQKVG